MSELFSYHVKNVCRLGQGAVCCRYLTASKYGFECEKYTLFGRFLDARVEGNEMVSRGDNCVGRHGIIRDWPEQSANDEPDPRSFA